MNREQLAKMIDQTLLKPNVTLDDLRRHCETALQYGFGAVAVNSAAAGFCAEILKGSPVRVAACVGFPLGQSSTAVKVFEAQEALAAGAGEIDYVVNLVDVKSDRWDLVGEEMRRIAEACRAAGAASKVIFETCYLTHAEKLRLCLLASRVRPTFVKTSTGFGTPGPGLPTGATLEDVRLMKEASGVQVKASGGIRTTEQALAMIEAGASRIGASNGVAIVEGLSE